jgi:hypothetical protein
MYSQNNQVNQGNQVNDLNNKIAMYQKQKQICESERQTLNTELGISQHNLAQLSTKAKELFGTDNPNELSTLLNDMTLQSETLEQELITLQKQNEMI